MRPPPSQSKAGIRSLMPAYPAATEVDGAQRHTLDPRTPRCRAQRGGGGEGTPATDIPAGRAGCAGGSLRR
jgi:hypothetical protein